MDKLCLLFTSVEISKEETANPCFGQSRDHSKAKTLDHGTLLFMPSGGGDQVSVKCGGVRRTGGALAGRSQVRGT